MGESSCGIEIENKFDRTFNEGIMNNSGMIKDDPMMSSSFELTTLQHPFEETLQLPEDAMEDIDSPRSTILYASSPDGEDAEDMTYKTKAPEVSAVQTSPPPTGYPNSIHSYSQLSTDHDVSDDVVVVEDEPLTNELVQDESISEVKNNLLGVQNTSPFK